MRKILFGAIAVGLALGAMALSGGNTPTSDLVIEVQERNPWTHLRLNNDSDSFHFAIVSDRTGGHRAQVFSRAVDQLNLLQPSFVVSVGDLIEGYTKSRPKLDQEWKEMQTYVAKLQMPFFYVPGNHDVTNAVGETEWKERFGRPYYHFLYKNVLFLCLNSSDPFEEKAEVQIGKEQLDYFRKVLKENQSARWTIVLVHKPMWLFEKVASSGWHDVEEMLQGRKYTVFAGHVHRYQKFVRHGMNYYMLSTTGGASRMRGMKYGEFDHIAWITMKKDGPVMANILLDGVYPEDMKKILTEEDAHMRINIKTTQPVKGRVLMDGLPIPNAYLIFHLMDADPKKAPQRIADAFGEADGTFVLTSYRDGDGAPAGKYVVTVVRREPFFELSGKLGKNQLPERYALPKDSDLRATVVPGINELVIELRSKD